MVLVVGTGLVVLGHMNGLVFEERPIRAAADATELARAALDYRADTGDWPLNSAGEPDLTPLLGRRAGRRATSLAAGSPAGAGTPAGMDPSLSHLVTDKTWLSEIPLDPWGRPYRILINHHAVAVISAGPNQVLDTHPVRVWTRPDHIDRGDGDDICIVLDTDQDGGLR